MTVLHEALAIDLKVLVMHGQPASHLSYLCRCGHGIDC
ncbi:hypothetical protein PAMC26577_25560 [Caballeronia sordidicola]|uniref:Uncharacterized protein n=1 Tax=Caballeronia sordidicola TaxID=196367 RepID=A0A242MIX5_CABSO|nr:hypothetical protein PAMC26577_25560 [Caballeronia sordidicola]